MAHQKNERQKEIKVEDLLRLKRAERPDDAFWGTFDRELHQRMLQTLVKKDPWHVQILRGLTGRFVQSAAVACAAAFIAMMVVRPAFVGTRSADLNLAENTQAVTASAPLEVAMSELDTSLVSEHDYRIDSISADKVSDDSGFTRDFEMEGFQLAYDSSDYSIDAASVRPAFGSTGVASLVY
jgi:hypothetical protein